MATLSELVKAIAAVQGFDENQVLWIARYLREDGLISKGGRGRGGAQMSVMDACNLLVGVNSPGSAKQSAELVRIICAMPLFSDYAVSNDSDEWDNIRSTDDFSKSFMRGSTFGSALQAVLIERLAGGPVHPSSRDKIKVTISGPDLSASIYLGEVESFLSGITGKSWASARFTNAETLVEAGGEPPDHEVSRAFTQRTLDEVGRVLTS